MAEEALDWLSIRPEGVYVDGTAGAGGHASLIAERLSGGRLLALDRDPSAVVLSCERLREFSCATVHHANYADLADVLAAAGIAGVDGVLIDAGCSSMQIDTAERGFSFQENGPLDMRMNPQAGETAAALLRRSSREQVESILREYGDVGPAGRIATAIKEAAHGGRLETTHDLVTAVKAALPFLSEMPDEVRTVFQAIRIAVNDELSGLRQGVDAAINCLNPGGRLVVIAFHSGEDRIVKQVMRDASRKRHTLHPDGRVKATEAARLKVLTPGPAEAGAGECARNPRAKSARLRSGERR
jgi:16S rRNA (cytosine1402-N4)-methyltransferase